RPAAMITPDFHTPQKTKLLWVYEGLTEYLGEVLSVRAGLLTPDEYKVTLTSHIRGLSQTAGRPRARRAGHPPRPHPAHRGQAPPRPPPPRLARDDRPAVAAAGGPRRRRPPRPQPGAVVE